HDIERALRLLPDSGICAISDDATSLFMLAPTDALFTVSVNRGKVTVRSRPLDAERLMVDLHWTEDSPRWSFRYIGEGEVREQWQDVSGSVAIGPDGGPEQLDDREQFARALAERAGWMRGARGRVAAESPSEGTPAESGQDEPRWRAQTDVWGRPLDVKRP